MSFYSQITIRKLKQEKQYFHIIADAIDHVKIYLKEKSHQLQPPQILLSQSEPIRLNTKEIDYNQKAFLDTNNNKNIPFSLNGVLHNSDESLRKEENNLLMELMEERSIYEFLNI